MPAGWLLLWLSLAAAGDSAGQYYGEVPPQYRRQFESGDKFSTIVRFVADAEANASRGLGCPGRGNRGRFPLNAFADSPSGGGGGGRRLRYSGFGFGQKAALSMANLMNYIYQLAARDFRSWFSDSFSYQAFWYSVVSSVVASDTRIFGCYVALFDDNSGEIVRDFVPHAYRNSSGQLAIDNYSKEVFVNLRAPGFEWYRHHVASHEELVERIAARPSRRISAADKRIGAFTASVLKSSGEGVKIVADSEGFWTPPVFVCSAQKWLVSYAVPFLSSRGSALRIKGWIVLEFDLRHLDVNQCKNDSTFSSFYATDVCNQATTECVHIPGRGFTDTSFHCKCKRFFHYGNFTGDEVRKQYLLRASGAESNYTTLECGPCPATCPTSCTKDGWCLIEYDLDTLRALPLVIQTFCLTVCLLVAGIVFKTRRSRVIKSSVWILLEIFILGVSILYVTVFLTYVRPTYSICFVVPWLREIGFTITYGTMLMKVYRILCSFQSRKAHRVHVRDRDLLKYLAGILSVAVGFMAAWTAATLDHGRRLRHALAELNCSSASTGHLVLEDGQVQHTHMGFRACAVGYWDAVCAAGEVAFLVVGLFYCYCVRSAPCDFFEVRCITAAYSCELVFSLCYHVARHFVWNSVHPDYVYLMYFARCHLTVTITAALVLGPKLWYVHSPPKNSLNNRGTVYSQVDSHLGEAISPISLPNNGDVDALEVNLTDMSPEDIRAELKRLYTQLQIFKTKVMRRENPHISKRKGGKKQTHRRFSLQPFYHKHSHKQQPAASVQEEEASKVSEDSSNSAEGQEQQERPAGKESTATSSSSSSK